MNGTVLSPRVRIEAASAGDLEGLAALHERELRPRVSLASAFGGRFLRASYRWILATPTVRVLVAREGERLAGFTSFALRAYSGAMLRACWPAALAGAVRRPAVLVHPELRARLARALRGAGTDLPPGTGHVLYTIVAPSHRGVGVGSALKTASFLAAKQAGLSGLLTGVEADNEASIRMNVKAGFREIAALRSATFRYFLVEFTQDEQGASASSV